MKKKDNIIGDYFSFKLKDWEGSVNGFLIAYNDEWVLLLNNPRDFIIDGYILFRYKYYESMSFSKEVLFTEKILRLKGIPDIKSFSFPIDNLETILSAATKKYGVFAFHRKPQYKFRVGRFKSLNSKKLVIQALDPDGQWIGTNSFRPGDIRTIEFNTDYLNSLMLVAKKKMPK